MIITSPGLEVTKVPPLKLAIGKLMYSVYPRFQMTNSLDVTGLSRDETVIAAYKADPLVHPMISARLGLDLLNTGKTIRENCCEIQFPLLILHGQKDRLVNISGTREFVSHMTGNVTFIEVPDSYHELHNEPNKQEVFKIWLNWLDNIPNRAEK
jgi:alpha-beta hydrolase superfamily lysophospholipase